MKTKMTEEMVVENLLSEWPIKERQHERQLNALVATLLNGEKRPIEFEKEIVPADVIGRYILIDHTFPESPMFKHIHESLGHFQSYDDALKTFNKEVEKSIHEGVEADETKELMLVGEFKNRALNFDFYGQPDVNTGIIMASTLTKLGIPLVVNYIGKVPETPTVPVVVQNKLYVELDWQTAELKFEQRVLQGNELNVEFWKVDPNKDISRQQHKSGGSEDDVLINKRKREDMSTERWVNDPLLSKRTGGKGHGNGIH